MPLSSFSPEISHALRFLSIDAVQKANSGHPGLPMGAADFTSILFLEAMNFDASAPTWPDRDRFVLSAGHGSMLLYAALHLLGYEDMPIEELKNFRKWGAKTAGHPEYGHACGIETTTGPLGQGFANAVGMAMAERHLSEKFGEDLVDHYTYAVVGDGCLMEGISQEALTLAGHLKLRKLIVLFDDNRISIDGPVSLADTTDQLLRFSSAGWTVSAIDGHNPHEVLAALKKARTSDRPSFIACRTTIGYGSPQKQGTAGAHGSPLGEEEIKVVRERLRWPWEPFEIPQEILSYWREGGLRGRSKRIAWEERLHNKPDSLKQAFLEALRGDLPQDFENVLSKALQVFIKNPLACATRNASQEVLDLVNDTVPQTVGGSADLTGSNNTKSKNLKPISPDDFSGRYVHWGVREHAMAACMNGLALHGGIIPYGGTFLAFSDYCRPAIRLSALMKQRVIYVMTHDSIGLGEDGPTHQPIEHLASLRAIPNLHVFRPCDRVETLECWKHALQTKTTPSLLALSRQKLPQFRIEKNNGPFGAEHGAYTLLGEKGGQVVLFASGSEVEIVVSAHKLLEERGIKSRVVSVPCFELFLDQPLSYQQNVLGEEPLRVGVEAGISMGWETFLGERGIFIGMEGFGASAPFEDLYFQFGITAEKVVERIGFKLGEKNKNV